MADTEAFKQFEAAGWGARAAGYGDLSGKVSGRLVEPLLDAAAVSHGMRVLDVATGPGYVAAEAARRGARPLGIDISEGMLEVARESNPHLDFELADVESLPFEDGLFDSTVGNFVLNHLPQPELAIAECARVLKAGGSMAFTVWDTPAENRYMGVVADALASETELESGPEPPSGPDPYRYADEREFEALLRQAGVEQVRVESIRFSHPASDVKDLWEGMLSGSVRASSKIGAQSDEVRARIRERFAANLNEHRDAEGVIQLPVSVKLAAGRKP
jgi:ubiquinone/menaquinone biosynthesis C-methylase UbiE